MPFCSQCGKELETSARFCPQCGKERSELVGLPGKGSRAATLCEGLEERADLRNRSNERPIPRKIWFWAGAVAVAVVGVLAALSIGILGDPGLRDGSAGDRGASPIADARAGGEAAAVYVNTFTEANDFIDGSVYATTYEKRLDEHGNVIGYSFVEGDSALSEIAVEMTYDDQGVPVACEGDISWYQEVLERDDEGRPLRVERAREEMGSTFFTFEYTNNGEVRRYSVEAADETQVYTIDDRGRISSFYGCYEDEVGNESEISYSIAFEEDSAGRVTESVRTDLVNTGNEAASYKYDDDGQLFSWEASYGDGDLSVEEYSYERIDDPSPMVLIWSRVFNRTNPLCVPTL